MWAISVAFLKLLIISITVNSTIAGSWIEIISLYLIFYASTILQTFHKRKWNCCTSVAILRICNHIILLKANNYQFMCKCCAGDACLAAKVITTHKGLKEEYLSSNFRYQDFYTIFEYSCICSTLPSRSVCQWGHCNQTWRQHINGEEVPRTACWRCLSKYFPKTAKISKSTVCCTKESTK